jgi:hypothetical protein
MAYFTESQIRRYAEVLELRKRASQYLCESAIAARVTIFLSHSHHDRDLAHGIILFLASCDITVYVDWNDSNMPRETNRETADKIKSRIATLKLFMVLATKNALNSKWVPWEIGIADKTKGEKQVLIIPVVDSSGSFDGSEYLRLYRRVVISEQGSPAVFEPEKTTDGRLLENFMKSFGT